MSEEKKDFELKEEELEKVSGGVHNAKEQGSKYKKDTYVKYYNVNTKDFPTH